MKTHIILVIAILAGLTTIGLNTIVVRDKITGLQLNLREQSAARERAEVTLATAEKNLAQASHALQRTTAALKTTEEANQSLLARIKDQDARAAAASRNLVVLEQKYNDTKANLAAYESVMTVEQAATVSRKIKSLQTELAVAKKENVSMAKIVAQQEAELNRRRGNIVFMPATLAGIVLATDPKWQFVVLSAGSDQGVVEHGELLVSRGGNLVGKVIVQRTEKDQSIANIMPGWELTEILEGDTVVPAHPRS